MTIRIILCLALVVTALAQTPQQGPQQLPKELDMYRIENVLPKSGAPLEISPESMERINKNARLSEQGAALYEYRRTGQTKLSTAEIDDILDEWGIKKNKPKFDNVPVCKPKKMTDICAAPNNEWRVFLDPSVTIAETEATVSDLIARYNLRKHPSRLHDYELPTGAYFVVEGAAEAAENLSKDPLVRLVEKDRIIMGSLNMTPKSLAEYEKMIEEARKKNPPKPAPTTRARPKPTSTTVSPKPIAQGVPFNLDRTDQRFMPVDNLPVLRPNNGANAEIYHLGGDIWSGHTEFASPIGGPLRTVSVFRFYALPDLNDCDRAFSIQSQHDTGVLSIAAGATIGMAPHANIVAYAPIKFYPSEAAETSTQNLILDSLTSIKNRIISRRPKGAVLVITMGLSGMPASFDTQLNNIMSSAPGGADTAVIVSGHQVTSSGIPSSVFWPQRNPGVMAVGSTNNTDTECSNNYGTFPCGDGLWIPGPLHIFAPGEDTNLAEIGPCAGGNPVFSRYAIKSGTSYSTPLIAGMGALILGGSKNTTYWPHGFQITQILSDHATLNQLNIRPLAATEGVANRLGYNNARALPVTANAASFQEQGARGGISAAFGNYLLAPNRVFFQFDCSPGCGTSNEASVFSGSGIAGPSGQVNFVVPEGTPTGTHKVKVFRDGTDLGEGIYKVNNTSPGFFTTNSLGFGTISGTLDKYNKVTGVFEGSVALTDSGAGVTWTANQNAFLILYGTGWRFGSSTTLTVGGTNVGVTFANASPCCIGLDQVNSGALPDSLKNSGVKSVVLTTSGVSSQPNVTVKFAP